MSSPGEGPSDSQTSRNGSTRKNKVASRENGIVMRNWSSRSSARPMPIPLKSLNEGHRMDPQERIFLEAAERGDKHTIMRCLQAQPHVNINCTNILGRSAIQIAVDNENIEIVELLLKQDGVKIGDALLYAIREGVYRIVEMLINHPSISRHMLGPEWAKTKIQGDESSDYSPDISPIILAAHCNQFEILQLLLSRGARIDRPHQLSCSCTRCREQVSDDSLRHSLLRIHTYRALASPAWISLTSPDPILTAFKLSWELELLANKENEFKDTYVELSENCKKYACDLLDQCRSSEEVIAVLNKGDGPDDDPVLDPEKLTLARLKLSLKYEQKRFVSHPHCQQLLASIWYDGLPGWRKRHTFTKFLICLGLICIWPFMAVYYLFFPKSQMGQMIRTPFMKFLYHSTSFVVFLLLLILASTEISSIDGRGMSRGPPPSQLEWLITFWVIGFIWSECKQLWEEGLKAYIRQWWNWLDFIMLALYLCTFSCRIVGYIQLEFWPERYGPRDMLRSDWPHNDPTLISEGLFAIANVFSFARFIYLFLQHPHLGPLQISLGCMLIDIAKFLFIFFLVLISFACGLNQLYWHYGNEDNLASDAFLTLPSTLTTLFWSLFSITHITDVVIDAPNLHIPQLMGSLLFGAYHVASIIVLLNMLIAMMSNSFNSIEDHADREWKFARSKLWMGYFDEGSTSPTPFNLIVSPKSVYFFLKATKDFLCKCCSREEPKLRRQSMGTIKRPKYTPNSETTSVQTTEDIPKYEDIMARLVSRYIHQFKKNLRNQEVNEDDLLEIKQDISSLRYELREDRKRETARATGHIDNLKRDIMRSLKPGLHSNMNGIPGNPPISPTSSFNSGIPYTISGNVMSQQELDYLKREITMELKHEIREAVGEIVEAMNTNAMNNSTAPALPSNSNDLYHTHLYTQL
ncbi:unnamed protein product [Owenia fusiformis]|uniref:Uncharacterized protein n=1 Tax=Owenia fusiformis TaxID=6347 RepID=A0A8J1THX0_OWEFU|nr:unnamed protein product [Owenia fusiformis]